MATLKEVAATAQVVSQVALEKALRELKAYINAQDTAGASAASDAVQNLQNQLDALVGSEDADRLINTFNEIKAFLADYSEDDTLKSLIDAVNTAISGEQARAEQAESALSGRITTLENVHVMTAEEAKTLFDSVFNPQQGA